MSHKVWVIKDSPKEQVPATGTSQKIISAFPQKRTIQRNPSVAYSLSIIVWGCGQFYNRQWKLGILFLLFMINFYLLMSIIFMYWEPINSSFESISIDRSGTLLILGLFYLSGIIVWHFNAWQAYFKGIKIHPGSPQGIKIPFLPVVCSLLIPGWGQLLNSQIKKGLFFQVFILTGLATLPFVLTIFLVWSTLEASRSRLVVEWIFSISIILSPLIILMWLLNIFDAAKVSTDNTKKEPMLKRIKHAANKFRYHIQLYGWKNAILPLIKRNILIILLLIFCVITYHSIPETFYLQQLQNLGNRMSDNEMTVFPCIIEKLCNGINSDEQTMLPTLAVKCN